MTHISVNVTDNKIEKQANNNSCHQWSIKHDVHIKGIIINENNSNIQTDLNLIRGSEYYLVWSAYSSGDSFGVETGKPEFIELFENETDAYNFRNSVDYLNKFKLLQSEYYGYTKKEKRSKLNYFKNEILKIFDSFIGIDKDYDNHHAFDINNQSFTFEGKEYIVPWGGHFENLEEVIVTKVILS